MVPAREKRERFEIRIKILWVVITCGFLILLARMTWLQLIEGERYFDISKNSRLQLLPLPCTRGLVLDRNGKKLTHNEASFAVGAVPANVSNPDHLLDELARILKLDKKAILERLRRASNPFKPVVLKKNVGMSTVTFLLEKKEEFPGVVIIAQPVRTYPYRALSSHLVGHLGEVSQAELSRSSGYGIEMGDLVGKMGVEKVYNRYLQGEKGGRQVEVDAHGRTLRTISEKDPLPGHNVYLTIDLRIQEIAEKELGKRKGVVLIGDPHTGEILALVSHPSFDPNLFSWGISDHEWNRLRDEPLHPLENRAIRGEYPPASTIKVITASAALEDGIISKEDTFFCGGSLTVGRRVFKGWKEGGHGRINLEEALIHSCDVYFYQLGLRLGVNRIIRYSRLFGLGEPTGIDLGSEKQGFLPTPEWKKTYKDEVWYGGDTVNLSIGQGYILVTPIQMLKVISSIANGGYLIRPYLIKKIVSPRGDLIKEFQPQKMGRVPLSSATLKFLRKSLRGVVQEGTGWRAKNKVVEVSGKTGTAELSEDQKPHNWFIGYAPSSHPRLAIVVLVENREEDIQIGAQITGKILSQIFERQGPES
ncbi:MAG: penicillin-binding protein 2 [bacterium]